MTVAGLTRRLLCTVVLGAACSTADAAEWFVAAGGRGPGTAAAPFGRLQDALTVAQPGDTVTVNAGTYRERIRTIRGGRPGAPIVVRGRGPRDAIVLTAVGRVVTVSHAYVTLQGMVLDGQYGASDTLRVESSGHSFTLRDAEVRRSTHDLIDLEAPHDVLIEGCLLHHALNAARGRTDAHAIAAGAVRNLTIRQSEIHTFSGDGFQVDPARAAPGWSDVTLDSVRFWLAPLPTAENGFTAGVVPGENAVDTKASVTQPRARLTIRNTTASGFRGGLISNMAAFNLKEHIDATLDRITVFDSEIAFRLRGDGRAPTGAWVTLTNTVVHEVKTAYRYEEEIQQLRIWNATIGGGVTRPFQAALSSAAGLDIRNLLVLGERPEEAAHPSNLAVGPEAFVDAAGHDYRLSPGAAAIDAGALIAGVSVDRNGATRPTGRGVDVGAYEWQPPRRQRASVWAAGARDPAGSGRSH